MAFNLKEFENEVYKKHGININSAEEIKAPYLGKTIGKIINDISGQTAQNEFSAEQAKIAYERQKEIAQNGYQWAMQDMQKAGLNPALMYGSGGAAIAGSAAQASASGNGAGIVTGISSIFNSAANLINANDNTKNRKTQQSIYNSAGKLIKTITNITSKI